MSELLTQVEPELSGPLAKYLQNCKHLDAKIHSKENNGMVEVTISIRKRLGTSLPYPEDTRINYQILSGTSADTEGYLPKVLLKIPKYSDLDDEYLPACCRNGKPHSHPV